MLATHGQPSSGQPPRYSFASFVFGPESLLAYRSAMAAATAPGTTFNPLYLQSAPGMGKTHLLKAIAQHLSQQGVQNVICVPGALCR